MDRKQVESSNLASVGYDANTKILEVEFNDGGIYQYSGVPPEIHTGLMNASSHGEYLNRHIKSGGYDYKKLN